VSGAELGQIETNGQEKAEEYASELETGRALRALAPAKRQRGYRGSLMSVVPSRGTNYGGRRCKKIGEAARTTS
jgi:predicted DNA-binding WGR domain protein